LAEFSVYGHGWLARLGRCASLAWKMAGLASAPPVVGATAAPPVVAYSEADDLMNQYNQGA
jgi:hypothetical protein